MAGLPGHEDLLLLQPSAHAVKVLRSPLKEGRHGPTQPASISSYNKIKLLARYNPPATPHTSASLLELLRSNSLLERNHPATKEVDLCGLTVNSTEVKQRASFHCRMEAPQATPQRRPLRQPISSFPWRKLFRFSRRNSHQNQEGVGEIS